MTRIARVEPVSVNWTKPTLSAAAQRAMGARQARRAGPRRAPFVLLISGLLAGGLCVLLVLNTASAANELRRHDVTTANAGLAEDVEQLRSKVAASAAPDALAAAAAKLGMVPNGTPAFLLFGRTARSACLAVRVQPYRPRCPCPPRRRPRQLGRRRGPGSLGPGARHRLGPRRLQGRHQRPNPAPRP